MARRGAELDPAMKIVFITGFAAVALSSGAPTPAGAKVLSKPFHLREIVDEVDKVMADIERSMAQLRQKNASSI